MHTVLFESCINVLKLLKQLIKKTQINIQGRMGVNLSGEYQCFITNDAGATRKEDALPYILVRRANEIQFGM